MSLYTFQISNAEVEREDISQTPGPTGSMEIA
jgi:hypothetical protein